MVWLHALGNNLFVSWALRHTVVETLTCSRIARRCQWVQLAAGQWLGEKIIWVNNSEPIHEKDLLTNSLPGFICAPWSAKSRFQSALPLCSVWRVVHILKTSLLWSPPELLNSPPYIVVDWDWLKKDWELVALLELEETGLVKPKAQVLLASRAPCHSP